MSVSDLSISRAWTETGQFLAREAGLVLPVALLLLALPPAAERLLIPPPGGELSLGQASFGLLLTLIVLVTSLIGSIAISHLALRPGLSVGEALRRGLRRFPSLLGASLLLAIPMIILAVIVVMAVAPNAAVMRAPFDPYSMPPALLWSITLFTLALLFIWVKLSMGTPVTSEERAGPVDIITRSWALTKGHYWKLLGTYLAVMILSSLAIMALTNGLGVLIFLAAGPPMFGNLSFIAINLVEVFLQTIMVTVLIILIARIYAQLTGGTEQAPA